MKRLLLMLLAVVGVGAGTLALGAAPTVFAQQTNKQAVCETIGGTSSGDDCTTTSGPSVSGIIETAVTLLSVIVGILAVFMIVFSGFRYITSAGDAAKIASAKNTLIYAIIGIVIVAFSQFIVQFVVDRTSANPSQSQEEQEE